jgi:hypothetical protein
MSICASPKEPKTSRGGIIADHNRSVNRRYFCQCKLALIFFLRGLFIFKLCRKSHSDHRHQGLLTLAPWAIIHNIINPICFCAAQGTKATIAFIPVPRYYLTYLETAVGPFIDSYQGTLYYILDNNAASLV